MTDFTKGAFADVGFSVNGGGKPVYDVVFSYKWGGEPSHHTFNTREEAEAFAREYTKGVYSTADGTLTKIDLQVRPGEPGANAAARGGPSSVSVTFDDNAPKGGGAPLRINGSTTAAARPLGDLSRKYEVGKGGPETISTGKGDPGGVSYGSYQLSSTRGTAQQFVNQHYATEFKGLKPGSEAFNRKWREMAANHYAEFAARQHDFIKQTHYDKAADRIRARTGVNFDRLPPAAQNALWSAAVQHGPAGAARIAEKVIDALDAPQPSPADLIAGMYAERGRTDKNGKLVRFKSSSKKMQEGVKKRFRDELRDALDDLQREQSAEGNSPLP